VNRPLIALAGLIVAGGTVGGALIIAYPGGEEEVLQQVETVAPTATTDSEPPFCPLIGPCFSPAPDALTYLPLGPAVINGVTIPLPDGAVHTMGLQDPGGGFHSYETENSRLAFLGNGWLFENRIAEGERDRFAAAIEALHKAAEPITFNGVVIPVPAGALAHPPIMEFAEGWAGSPGKAPNLFLIEIGDSYLSWDVQGNVVGDEVKSEDAADFAPIREALSLARQQ